MFHAPLIFHPFFFVIIFSAHTHTKKEAGSEITPVFKLEKELCSDHVALMLLYDNIHCSVSYFQEHFQINFAVR